MSLPGDEPDSWQNLRKWLAPWVVLNSCASFLILLIATGWLMLPAKSGDLDKTRIQLEALIAKVDKLDASMAKVLDRVEASLERLQYGQQQNREEIIRLTATRAPLIEAAAVEPPRPVAVVKKVRPKKKPPQVKQAEQPGFLGKLIQQ